MCEHGVGGGCVVIVSGVVQEAVVPRQRDVIEAEVEQRRVHHAESGKRKKCTDDGASEDVVPIVGTFDYEDTTLDRGVEEGRKDEDELPEARLVVREEFEFGVEVEGEEDGRCESRCGVAAGEGFQGLEVAVLSLWPTFAN